MINSANFRVRLTTVSVQIGEAYNIVGVDMWTLPLFVLCYSLV